VCYESYSCGDLACRLSREPGTEFTTVAFPSVQCGRSFDPLADLWAESSQRAAVVIWTTSVIWLALALVFGLTAAISWLRARKATPDEMDRALCLPAFGFSATLLPAKASVIVAFAVVCVNCYDRMEALDGIVSGVLIASQLALHFGVLAMLSLDCVVALAVLKLAARSRHVGPHQHHRGGDFDEDDGEARTKALLSFECDPAHT
jgi:hypothetical protein